MTAPAGWYVQDDQPGMLRYWDGQAWTDHTTPAVPPPSKRWGIAWSYWLKRTAVVVALVLVVGVMWLVFGYNSSENTAIRACHDYVELRLKAPATADFSGEFALEEETEDSWTVHGTVDSENGFGAKVRNIFTCEVVDGSVIDAHFSEADD